MNNTGAVTGENQAAFSSGGYMELYVVRLELTQGAGDWKETLATLDSFPMSKEVAVAYLVYRKRVIEGREHGTIAHKSSGVGRLVKVED